ncbi:superoxide dismutase [Akkermansia glycaniphila]|uniref:Superoxide dismutase n=1 Tax=Akkermansia glycaniphila TaxID=1679444 RepID=A0A1C7PF68_9BACT|nr:superoxide dismutase [Akkermansia glycaniphila]OCA04226.1 superoxide dismutase [Akkermansia glycaniphila]SEH76565.1 manganese superoxide dismutase signature [Akkermansia glycaniphila]
MKTEQLVYADGQYVLPPLPYAYDALEPLMDEATLHLHHDKHHAAYVAGANTAVQKLREITEGKLDAAQTTNWVRALSFNESGHVLHTIFWTNMSPTPKTAPEGPLMDAIVKAFGSFDGFMLAYRSATAGIEGSGWGILGVEPLGKTLVICGAEKHQNYEIPGIIPILACDVWEHAYYLKHQNNRAAYIDNFLKLVDWQNVEERYNAALGK